MTRLETVTIVYRYPRILLGRKKKKLGAGRYNGFGGGMESFDKSIYDTAIRETQEEVGITLINPERMGRILFHFQCNEQDHDVHFFRARRYLGSPKETDEMTAEWFNIDNIPYNQMWADDKYWLPLLIKGKKFLGEFLFNPNHKIVEHILQTFNTRECFEDTLAKI
ncbi:MAG: 8-oxo-dGTP diphosphatase [Nanoarchaeota archaeon]|nr:8-oxo-dGTP diphosphatase [Nanoarchaeota archaeon]